MGKLLFPHGIMIGMGHFRCRVAGIKAVGEKKTCPYHDQKHGPLFSILFHDDPPVRRKGILPGTGYIVSPLKNTLFCRISASSSNFNPWNIPYIPAVKIFALIDLEQKLSIFQRPHHHCCRDITLQDVSGGNPHDEGLEKSEE